MLKKYFKSTTTTLYQITNYYSCIKSGNNVDQDFVKRKDLKTLPFFSFPSVYGTH